RFVSDRFAKAVERAFNAARAGLQARAGLTAMTIFLVFASIVGVLWYGAEAVVRGEIPGGRLSQFVLYAALAAAALARLSGGWGEGSRAAGAAGRRAALLAGKPRIRAAARPLPWPEPARGEISFRHVSFRYPSREESALSAVSFEVAPGETVAIVGPSGAGKSTVFNLLLRFFDPDAGEIRVDGVPIGQADLVQLRKRMALVPQEV